MADEPAELDCALCDEPLTTDTVWINPLGYRGNRLEDQAIDLGPSVGTAESDGGYAPYDRKCAAEEWPELGLAER